MSPLKRSNRKKSAPRLHLLLTNFTSLRDLQMSQSMNPSFYEAACSPRPVDRDFFAMEDYQVFANALCSPAFKMPSSGLLRLSPLNPPSNQSFEHLQTRGYMPRGTLKVCNPDIDPTTGLEFGAPAQSPEVEDPIQSLSCANGEAAKSTLTRRGALRIPRSKRPNAKEEMRPEYTDHQRLPKSKGSNAEEMRPNSIDHEIIPAVTFNQIMLRHGTTQACGIKEPKQAMTMFGKAARRAKTVFDNKNGKISRVGGSLFGR